jgi:hypothetical protein
MSKIKDHSSAQLLVEGNDDFHVVHALFKKYNVTTVRNIENPDGGLFSVKDCNGVEKLLEQIPVQLKNLQKIGLILDADADLNNRWLSLSGIFKKQGFKLPKSPELNGTIVEQNGKTIGIWLMPDNNNNGMLEDFINYLIHEDDKLIDKATKILDELESEKINKYNLIHRSKAKIHTWLAWQETPGSPMGKAITARYLLPENKEISDKFVDWIKQVFKD